MNASLPWVFDDGGRAAAGFSVRSEAHDCVARSIAIATGRSYREVYTAVAEASALTGGRRSGRDGVSKVAYRRLLTEWDVPWTPTMRIGSGCTVRLSEGELPVGRLIVKVSKHLTAVIDGVIHDTFDPTRDGKRCVYGYWTVA